MIRAIPDFPDYLQYLFRALGVTVHIPQSEVKGVGVDAVGGAGDGIDHVLFGEAG